MAPYQPPPLGSPRGGAPQAGKLTGTAPMPDYSEAGLGGHEHKDKRGYMHTCYHKCKGVLTSWQFWLGITLSFPMEHLLWEKLWPFYLLTKALGL